MTFRSLPLALLATLLVVVLLLPACDTLKEQIFPNEITFGGVTYATVGDAELFIEDGRLIVSNIGTSGNDGVRASSDQAIATADIRTLPVDIPAGGRWGMEVFGDLNGARTALATVWNEAIDGERHQITFDYAPALGVQTVTLEYYLNRELVLRIPGVPTASAAAGSASRSFRAAPAGTSGDDPRSVHVVLVNGVYVVATDYDGPAPLQGCAGTLLQLDFPDAPSELCTDFVQAVPETTASFPDATSIEVRARTLERFAIEDGDLN